MTGPPVLELHLFDEVGDARRGMLDEEFGVVRVRAHRSR
jgi:hypothetical protein